MDWIKVLNIIILLLLISTFIEVNYFKLDNCDKCHFNINKTTYTSKGILKIYLNQCTKRPTDLSLFKD